MGTQSDKDAEYQFHEGQSSDVYANTPAGPPGSGAGLQKRNVLLIIVVLIILFSLYQAVHSYFSSGKKETQTQTTTPKISDKPVVTTSPTITQPASGEVDQKLASLQSNHDNAQKRVESLENSISQLKGTMSNIKNRIYTMNASIASLTDTIQSQQTQIAGLAKKPKTKPVKKAKPKPLPIFNVQAMLSGRAWLVTPQGGTLTVVVGDNLPGYGRILSITPSMGLIKTSTGRKLTFKPDSP